MAHSQSLSITLSDETVAFIRSKIASGEYASESDVLQEGIETLRQEAEERERWEREVLMPTHDRLMANPSSALSLEEVEGQLEASRLRRMQAAG